MRFLIAVSAFLLAGCGGGGVPSASDAGSDAHDAGADVQTVIPCLDADIDASPLCACACDTQPLPPQGNAHCSGPCTYHPTDAGDWCHNGAQVPECLTCLNDPNPLGCKEQWNAFDGGK